MKLKNAQIFEGDTPQKTNKCPPENHRLEDVFSGGIDFGHDHLKASIDKSWEGVYTVKMLKRNFSVSKYIMGI